MTRWMLATMVLGGLLISAGYRSERSPVTELTWRDLNGQSWQWHASESQRAAVFVTLSSRCPAIPRYALRLNALYQTYQPKGIAFFGVYPEPDESDEGVRSHAQQMGFQFPVVRQDAPALAKSLGATHVPQAFVVSPKGKVLYAGAIDSATKREVGQHAYLRAAVDAVVNRKPIRIARTPVGGCFLRLPETPTSSAKSAEVTFAEHIAPILYNKCTPCHRPDDTR